jgi:protein-disulfide isomerase
VTVELWSDFECPGCQRFAQSAERLLQQTLVADGTMRLVYRHFAFLGEESVWAAAAAECAADQDRFWEYHDALFTHTAGRDKGVFTKPLLKAYAASTGLDSGAFATCVDSGRYEDSVRAETQVGRQNGVTGTPTLFVNGHRVSPVPGIDELRALILAAAR